MVRGFGKLPLPLPLVLIVFTDDAMLVDFDDDDEDVGCTGRRYNSVVDDAVPAPRLHFSEVSQFNAITTDDFVNRKVN